LFGLGKKMKSFTNGIVAYRSKTGLQLLAKLKVYLEATGLIERKIEEERPLIFFSHLKTGEIAPH